MAVLFILVGLSFFLAGFTLYIKKTLVKNRSWAYKCLIFPPLCFIDFRESWYSSKDSALLQLAGVFILSIGVAFAVNNPKASSADLKQQMSGNIEFNNNPSKNKASTNYVAKNKLATNNQTSSKNMTLLEQIKGEGEVSATGLMSSITSNVKNKVNEISEIAKEESSNLISNVQMNRELSGQLNSQSFKPDVITFKEGRLRFKQGGKLFGDKEIIILLPESNFSVQSGFTLQMKAEQQEGPEIHLSWLEDDTSTPETKILKTGYILEIECDLVSDEKLNARILFTYSNEEINGKLSGSFVAERKDAPVVTDVPLSDHEQLKSEVLKNSNVPEHSETKKESITVESVETSTVASKSTNKQPSEIADNPSLAEILESEETAYPVKTVSMEDVMEDTLDKVIDTPEVKSDEVAIDENPKLVPHTDIQEQYLKPETTLVLQKLEPFWGKNVVITSQNGSTAEGLLKEVRRGEIAVEMRVGSGTMEKLTPLGDFKSVELK